MKPFENLDLEDIEGEIWADPIFTDTDGESYDYTGFYQISSLGRVKALERTVSRKPLKSFKGGNSQKRNGSILKQRISNKGRLHVSLCKKGVIKQWQVSRLVGLTFVPNSENKPEINHLKGFQNNCKDDLEWATRKENHDHAVENGLRPPKGQDNKASKLTNEQVKVIFDSRLTQNELSAIYKVDQTTISLIKTGKKWSWLTGKIYQKRKGLVGSISENSKKVPAES